MSIASWVQSFILVGVCYWHRVMFLEVGLTSHRSWTFGSISHRAKRVAMLERLQPAKAGEAKPIERVSGVRRPTIDVYPAKNNPSGTSVIILPGGGFGYVVPNLEGSEAAAWLNEIGITAFVLRYRTKEVAGPWRTTLATAPARCSTRDSRGAKQC